MKKLNRKGFTLVELLAVIVILAIVVGITLVTVLPTLQNARKEAFELTAQTAADFVEKEYQLSLIGKNTKLTNFGKVETVDSKVEITKVSFDKTTITAAGLKAENYKEGTYYINPTTGRACVELTAANNNNMKDTATNLNGETKAGEYYDVTTTAKSSGCN